MIQEHANINREANDLSPFLAEIKIFKNFQNFDSKKITYLTSPTFLSLSVSHERSLTSLACGFTVEYSTGLKKSQDIPNISMQIILQTHI